MKQRSILILATSLLLTIAALLFTSLFFKDFEATNIPLGSCPKCISGFVEYGMPFVSFLKTYYFGEHGEGIGGSKITLATTLFLNFLIYFIISFIVILTTKRLVIKLKKLRPFTSKNFLLIEFIFIVLLEISRLIGRYELLAGICGGYPYCPPPGCQYVAPPISCSDVFARIGLFIFSLLFIAYLISFVIYRAIKKELKGATLPVIIVIGAIFVVDWIVRMVL